MDSEILFNVFVFLTAMCVAVPLASRFRLGSVLGYLVVGIMIGPFGLDLIDSPQEILEFSEFGIVMMLFVIGMELEPAMLWRMRQSIVGLGGLQVVLSSGTFTLIGIAMGYEWQPSLAIGMALSLSSTALVLQLLQEKNLIHTTVGETSLAILLFQDMAVIPILIIMPLLVIGEVPEVVKHQSLLGDLPGWEHALVVAAAIGGVVVLGRYVSHWVFALIAKTRLREAFTAMSLALVVGITLLMQLLGISPALGAFIAGMVLANSEYKHTLETDIEPFKGLLLGVFFISVGMSMDFGLLAAKPLQLLAAVLMLLTVKASILAVLTRAFRKLNTVQTIGLALALSQGGEFAFVLFRFAQGLDVIPESTADFWMLAVALSMATTPLLMLLYNRYIRPRFMSLLPVRDYDIINAQNPVIIAGFGRFGQVIGRFLIGQGIKVTVLEKDPDQIELLRKFGSKGYFGDASRVDLLRNAGAATAKILVIAIDDADTCLEMVRISKEHFPHLKVYARARNRRHAYELHKAGVDYFKREMFDSSISMAVDIMVGLGRHEPDMQRKAVHFLRHDESSLRKSFEFFEDEPQLVNFARLQREELEQILRDDVVSPD